ncbi:hypothetical protein KJZ61_02430 [Candidatus Dependentiae bacterium]|nr:hypothetical protein [Candidatus Dependentiae bacterium]
MRHFPSDKYNLAWFKLAECVTRGEKERALGVYRLLSHSIDDKAYALKLEGDILSSFNDSAANERYRAALLAYREQGRVQEAIGISEYLLSIDNHDMEILEQLLNLYKQTGSEKQLARIGAQFLVLLIKNNQFDVLDKHLQEYYQLLEVPEVSDVMRIACGHYSMIKHAPIHIGELLLNITLIGLLRHENPHELQQFLAQLSAENERYYLRALEYLAEKKVKE